MQIAKVAVILFLATGCGGGDDGGPGDPVSTDEASRICDDFMAHATSCGWGGNINGADWNCGEAAVVWRAEVFRDVAACGTELSCTGDGASCVLLWTQATPLAIHDDYAAHCQARKTECDLVPSGDTSQTLLSCNADALAAYATTVMDAIAACFDELCASVVACLDSTL